MPIFITDNEKSYSQSSEEFKILILNGIIQDQNFLSESDVFYFNSQQNALENDASELMINELKSVASTCSEFKVNPYLKTRSKYDIAYSLLYPNFKIFVYLKYWLQLFIEKLFEYKLIVAGKKLNLYLSDSFSLIKENKYINENCSEINFYHLPVTTSLNFIKNLLYKFYNIFFSPKKSEFSRPNNDVINIALIIYDTFNDIELFRSFLSYLKNNPKFKITIIQIGSGIPVHQRHSAAVFDSSNIKTYKLEQFRDFVSFSNKDFYEKIETYNQNYKIFSKQKINDNLEVYYSFVASALKKIKPNITIYDNTGDVGRMVSDVSRFLNIPSLNVEYGLFSDDAIHMESNIQFDYKACLGQASADLWKKRNDPTKNHVPIGFLKLDNIDVSDFDKNSFFKKNNLNPDAKTLFFASTWAGTNALYNIEKQEIVKQLANLCFAKKWNLIIKKHPAENDNTIDIALKLSDLKELLVCSHNQINLYEAIFYCDIVTTQSSSVSVEALALSKPVIFFNLSDSKSLADLSVMKNESFVLSVNSITSFEKNVEILLEKMNQIDFDSAKKKYLYSTDCSTHKRLARFIEEIVK